MHVAEPEQFPNQPENCCPLPGTAESVTVDPVANLAEQVAPQLIPPELDVTTPTPLTITLSSWEEAPLAGTAAKVAVTLLAAFTVMVQLLEPEHAPDHPTKTLPVPAVAISVTVDPAGMSELQSLSHTSPVAEELTEPAPVTVTLRT